MLSLRTWSRGLSIASAALIVVCAGLLAADELEARRTRALLDEQWEPAVLSQMTLQRAELRAITAVQASIDHHAPAQVARANADVQELGRALRRSTVPGTSSALDALDRSARAAAASWLSTVAEPALGRGLPRLRTEHVLLAASMLDASHALGSTLDEARTQLRDSLEHTETLLRSTFVIETVLLMVLLVALLVGTERRVLRPIRALRDDLGRAAREHEHVIRRQGPPEIADVGTDAEHLRRSLVQEHDTSVQRAAAIDQRAPITAAIRAELDLSDRAVAGVHGFHRPIEGVIAGDWWWAGSRPDGVRMFAVADVSGHGVTAGVMALQTQAIVSAALTASVAPVDVVRLVADRAWPSGMFATLFVGAMDGDRLDYCSAGHPCALVLAPERTDELAATGPVVSGLGGHWRQAQVVVPTAGACLIATDGLLEASDEDDVPRWAAQAWRTAGGDAAEALQLLTAVARERSRTWTDDITALLVAVGPRT